MNDDLKLAEEDTASSPCMQIGRACEDDFGQFWQSNGPSSPVPKHAEPIDWDSVNKQYKVRNKNSQWRRLPTIRKNLYKEDEDVALMSPEDVKRFRVEKHNISVSHIFGDGTEEVPNPVQTFEQCFKTFPEILSKIYKQNYITPSPIQSQAWPILLRGHDLIAISQTGSGNTLAFLLPALIHIDGQPIQQRSGANVLVLAPTHELALQIEKEVNKYHYKNMKCICIYGGGDRRQQIHGVTQGVDIIIATPGRLINFIRAGFIDPACFTFLVLDEADRMLGLGFEPQIRKILLEIRPDRQIVMTSATWPAGVRRLALAYLQQPIQLYVGSLELAAVHSVSQRIEIIDEADKSSRLRQFIDQMKPNDKVIVFVGKKSRVDDISSKMHDNGVEVQSIHGDREQRDREQALEDLKSGNVRILIATDVAARGIGIKDVTHIFNYDFSRNIEEYVHRVGRTGRAEKTGEAVSLFTPGDWARAKELIPILEEALQEVPEELRSMAEGYEAWKKRRKNEKERDRMDGGGGRRRRRRGFRGGFRGGWGRRGGGGGGHGGH